MNSTGDARDSHARCEDSCYSVQEGDLKKLNLEYIPFLRHTLPPLAGQGLPNVLTATALIVRAFTHRTPMVAAFPDRARSQPHSTRIEILKP